jgi:hypothetical protein
MGASGWSIETALEHILTLLVEADKRYTQQFIAQEKMVTAAFKAADMALNKAVESSDARLAAMNEFRGALTDQATQMLSRTEANQRITTLEDRITKLENIESRSAGFSSQKTITKNDYMWIIALAVSLVAILVTLFTHYK